MRVRTAAAADTPPPAQAEGRIRTWAPCLLVPGATLLAGVAAALFAVAAAGAVLALARGWGPVEAARAVAVAGLLRPGSLAAAARAATPLLLAGLAAAIALRAGLVNLGIQGQAMAGALAATLAGAHLAAPPVLHLALVLLAAMAGGLAWTLLPTLLLAWRRVPELLSTVLASGLALAVLPAGAELPRVRSSAVVGGMPGAPAPGALTWILPLALLAVLAWWLAARFSRFGLKLRALRVARREALLAGIRPSITLATALLLSGAVAGLCGLQDALAPGQGPAGAHLGIGLAGGAPLDLDLASGPGLTYGYGLAGVAIALAGRGTPAGLVAAALAFPLLSQVAAAAHMPGGGAAAILQGAALLSVLAAVALARRMATPASSRLFVALVEAQARTADPGPDEISASAPASAGATAAVAASTSVSLAGGLADGAGGEAEPAGAASA